VINHVDIIGLLVACHAAFGDVPSTRKALADLKKLLPKLTPGARKVWTQWHDECTSRLAAVDPG
jgi:hypothetical protein